MQKIEPAAAFRRVESLYQRALDLPLDRREAFLGSECAGDAGLRGEVDTLLKHHDRLPSGYLETPLHDLEKSDALEVAIPQRIGGFPIIRLLGRGGMGAVYEAEQAQPRRRVALKVIRSDAVSEQALHRFRHEANVLGQLRHPGIAQIYEFGVGEVYFNDVVMQRQPFFAMELVRGHSLTEYAAARRIDRRALLELLAAVCDAVHHAHQKGVIHRDLKPSNIVVDEEGRPRVLDFGVARVTQTEGQTLSAHTSAGQLLGTIPYMSPEQLAGEAYAADTRSDVYALGVMAYEVLTGRLPLDVAGLPPAHAIKKLSESDARPAGAVKADLRGDVESILARALERDPNRRYGSAAELATDIRRYLNHEPIAARPPSRVYQWRKFAQRNKALVGGIAATLLALVLGIIGTTYGTIEAGRERDEARRQTVLADAARTEAVKHAKRTEQVADFQAHMLADVDVEAMGRGLKQRYRQQIEAGLERGYVGEWPDRRRRTVEEVAAELASFDQLAATAAPADVARRVMDEYLLQPATGALEKQFGDQPLVRAQIHQAVGTTYQALGIYDAARPQFEMALELRRRELGNENLLVATSSNNLAVLLDLQGDHTAAETLHRATLALRRTLQGDQHPDVATSLNNLGGLLRARRDYPAAESLYREALALNRKWLGEEHMHVASGLNNLALLLQDKGDYAAAEAAQRESLEMRRKLFGAEHADVASSLDNLACLLRLRGDTAAAERLFDEALALRRKLLGDEHPDVASTLNNLALLMQTRSDYAAAERLFREALALHRKLLGDEHPKVALSLNNLALLLHNKGDYSAAEPLYREALAMRRRLLGDEHPDVANSLNNLGGLLKLKGDLAAAEPLHHEALALQRKLLGDETLEVATSLTNLASLLHAKRDYDAAEPLFREALAIRRKLLGEEHREVATALNNLAGPVKARGDSVAAERLYREALAVHLRLGERHPHVPTTMTNLARLLTERGDYAAAEPIYREALDLQHKILGDDHPGVATTLNNLAGLLRLKGDNAAAEPLYREAMQIWQKRLPPGHFDSAQNRRSLGRTLISLAADPALAPEARIARLAEAQTLLLAAHEALSRLPNAPPTSIGTTLEGLIELYDARHAAEPEQGFDAQATHWRDTRARWQASTQPASTDSTAAPPVH